MDVRHLLGPILLLTIGCTAASDPSTEVTPTARFEGRTWIDGQPVEPAPVRALGEVQHRMPEDPACSDAWWLRLSLGRPVDDDWNVTWVNVFALSEFEEGQTIPLHEALPYGTTVAPLGIQRSDADPWVEGMRGGHVTVEVWERDHIELSFGGGDWCERAEPASEWVCAANHHAVTVERMLVAEGCCDVLWEFPNCLLASGPPEDWLLVEGTGTFCPAIPGSLCPDDR